MEGKKKRKTYFSNQGNDAKKKKRLTLECGMKGFLCTCNFREKDCVREAYNLLNEYAEKIYKPAKKQAEPVDESIKSNVNDENNTENEVENEIAIKENEEKELTSEKVQETVQASNKQEKEDKCNNSEEEDISIALSKEINELKAETGRLPSEKKFQVVDTGVNNVIFIKSTVPNTLELVTAIIEDLQKTKKQKTRYLLRILPVQITCKAYLDDIRPKAEVLFEQYFSQEPKTFCIVFNRRSNSNLHRNEVIEDLAQIISKKNPGNKANLKNPDVAVVVEVVRAVCLISIAPNYFVYKKYNLLEICNQKN